MLRADEELADTDQGEESDEEEHYPGSKSDAEGDEEEQDTEVAVDPTKTT